VQLCRDHPLKATIAVLRGAAGKRIAIVRSGADGHFRKALAPGTYRLVPAPTAGARAAALTVRVPADHFLRLTVRYRSADR
jgi:hypothetical protein